MKRKSPKTAEAEAREFFDGLPEPVADVTDDVPSSATQNATENASKTGPVADVADVAHPAGDRGDVLLDEVEGFLDEFVIYPSEHERVAHTLWVAHTHLMDVWDSTPRIAFLSPEPASGKTRALEVTELLVPRPVEAVNVTPAYLFRKVGSDDGTPTILYDEIDTVFGNKAKDNEEIRGLLNAGHRRGAVAGRCVVKGKIVETEEISAYCAVALAGLGWLPDTIMSRSVNVRMQRRKSGEKVKPFRRRVEMTRGHALRDRLSRWAAKTEKSLKDFWPEMPEGIEDRNADIWEALLAVADKAEGEWPGKAREAAKAIVKSTHDMEPSLGIRLLSDLKETCGEEAGNLATETILSRLHALKESPWNDLKGKPLNDRGLAQRLKQYGIKAKRIRVGESVLRGYEIADLRDKWERYLPPPSTPPESATSATGATSEENLSFFNGEFVAVSEKASATEHSTSATAAIAAVRVTIVSAGTKVTKVYPVANVADVAHVAHPAGNGGMLVCAQCGAGSLDDPPTIKMKTGVWVHAECKRFWHEAC